MKKRMGSVLLLLLAITFSSVGQKPESVFKGLTWEQASVLAQKEGKVVMVDVMRPTRTPQEKAAKEAEEKKLFAMPGVMDFFNKNLIAIRMDMSTEEGAAFGPKLMMNMYPTYGFFMPDGDILGVISPYTLSKEPELLLKNGEKALKAAEVKRNNSRSIQFEEMTLKEAMEKSKKDNKLIFIDAYTDYCQPCMLMVKNVFSLNGVADFYNQNFINLKIHFGKEKELAEKYKVGGYPSFLFLNGEGKLVHLAGGYTEGDKFIGYGEMALKKAEGIEFAKGDWNSVLEQAKKENKLIFMDCYTSWCGPCKQMAKTVFTDPDVAAFFNEHFLNVKMDMENGEGKLLKDKYEVRAYPTLNFLNGEGEMVHSVVGGLKASEFIEQANVALEGKGLAFMKDAYEKGNREPQFIEAYLKVLDLAYQSQVAETVTLDYFANLDKSKLKGKGYWDLFNKYVKDVDSDVFRYVYDNRKELESVLGVEVTRKIKTVWTIGANQFVRESGDRKEVDVKGFNQYVKRLKKTDVIGVDEIIVSARMNNAEKTGDWKTYVSLGDVQLKEGKVSDLVLYNWGLRVSQKCHDTALRMHASKWFEDAVIAATQKESEGKDNRMSYKSHFQKLATDLKNVNN